MTDKRSRSANVIWLKFAVCTISYYTLSTLKVTCGSIRKAGGKSKKQTNSTGWRETKLGTLKRLYGSQANDTCTHITKTSKHERKLRSQYDVLIWSSQVGMLCWENYSQRHVKDCPKFKFTTRRTAKWYLALQDH